MQTTHFPSGSAWARTVDRDRTVSRSPPHQGIDWIPSSDHSDGEQAWVFPSRQDPTRPFELVAGWAWELNRLLWVNLGPISPGLGWSLVEEYGDPSCVLSTSVLTPTELLPTRLGPAGIYVDGELKVVCEDHGTEEYWEPVETWKAIEQGGVPPLTGLEVRALGSAPDVPDRYWGLAERPYTRLIEHRSGWQAWRVVSVGGLLEAADDIAVLAGSEGAALVLVGNEGPWLSRDGGESWRARWPGAFGRLSCRRADRI